MFEASQITFISPLDWIDDGYKDDLRALFELAQWINAKDNKAKLVFIPFLEALITHLHDSTDISRRFERERKSIIFNMQAASDSAETILNITCFQMQSAKELIVISKSLASSNFLLEPNVKSSKSIRLRSLYSILNSRICRMLVNANAKEQDIPEACKSLLAHLNFIFDHVRIH